MRHWLYQMSNCKSSDVTSYRNYDQICKLGGSDHKEFACNAGDLGSIPGLGRSPGGGHDNPFQCSCLENPHGQRNLAGYSLRSRKESGVAEWLTLSHFSLSVCRQLVRGNLNYYESTWTLRSYCGDDLVWTSWLEREEVEPFWSWVSLGSSGAVATDVCSFSISRLLNDQ